MWRPKWEPSDEAEVVRSFLEMRYGLDGFTQHKLVESPDKPKTAIHTLWLNRNDPDANLYMTVPDCMLDGVDIDLIVEELRMRVGASQRIVMKADVAGGFCTTIMAPAAIHAGEHGLFRPMPAFETASAIVMALVDLERQMSAHPFTQAPMFQERCKSLAFLLECNWRGGESLRRSSGNSFHRSARHLTFFRSIIERLEALEREVEAYRMRLVYGDRRVE